MTSRSAPEPIIEPQEIDDKIDYRCSCIKVAVKRVPNENARHGIETLCSHKRCTGQRQVHDSGVGPVEEDACRAGTNCPFRSGELGAALTPLDLRRHRRTRDGSVELKGG
jgi:hypothetical protein